MAESSNSNGSRVWMIIAGVIAAWSFLIEPYVSQARDLRESILMAAQIGKEHVEMRYVDNRRDIDKLDARLSNRIEAETVRNNELEGRMSAAESFIQSVAAQTHSRFTKEDAQDLEARINERFSRLEARR